MFLALYEYSTLYRRFHYLTLVRRISYAPAFITYKIALVICKDLTIQLNDSA